MKAIINNNIYNIVSINQKYIKQKTKNTLNMLYVNNDMFDNLLLLEDSSSQLEGLISIEVFFDPKDINNDILLYFYEYFNMNKNCSITIIIDNKEINIPITRMNRIQYPQKEKKYFTIYFDQIDYSI